MTRARQIENVIKKHDPMLVCRKDLKGVMRVFRKAFRKELIWLDDNKFLIYGQPELQTVFSITEDWTERTKPVDWGIEPILARLKAIDAWSNESLMEELMSSYEKSEESKRRAFRNDVESFMYEMRPAFKKTFSDTRTALMNNKF